MIIECHINEIIQFIEKSQKNNKNNNNCNILFHCMAGVNRSVTLCIAYLLSQGYELFEAINLVSKKRNCGILSNLSFVIQIANYALSLNRVKL